MSEQKRCDNITAEEAVKMMKSIFEVCQWTADEKRNQVCDLDFDQIVWYAFEQLKESRGGK